MEHVELDGAGFSVSRVGLGTWAIGGTSWGGADREESVQAVLAALEKGITLVDTAPIYGYGEAEEVVGEAVKRHGDRDGVILATKVGLEWDDRRRVRRNSSPARVRRECEDSLRRLGTDRIDLYQIHWPDPDTPPEATAEALHELLEDGLVRAVGVSNFPVERMAAFRRAGPLHSAQPPYNLFEREIEDDVLPWCRDQGVAVLAYGALCRGLLSGRMTRDRELAPGDIRRIDPKFQAPRFEWYLAAADALGRFARERVGKELLPFAVRWILDRPGVTAALWGARRPAQLEPLDEVWGWSVDDDAAREVDRILEEHVPDPVGAGFMAPP